VEIVHRGGNIRWKLPTYQAASLRTVKRYKLQSNRQPLFKSEFFPKENLDRVIEVNAASLKFGAQSIVNSVVERCSIS
jgi:hypothetical protein